MTINFDNLMLVLKLPILMYLGFTIRTNWLLRPCFCLSQGKSYEQNFTVVTKGYLSVSLQFKWTIPLRKLQNTDSKITWQALVSLFCHTFVPPNQCMLMDSLKTLNQNLCGDIKLFLWCTCFMQIWGQSLLSDL